MLYANPHYRFGMFGRHELKTRMICFILVFALCSSFIGSLAMPSMAFAAPVDASTFTSVYMNAPKASEDTGVAFTVSAIGLLNSPPPGTQLPDTRLVITYDPAKVTPGNPVTWGFVGLEYNAALSATPGKLVFDVVAPGGGFGPSASQIAANATFLFPSGVTANNVSAAFSAEIFYGADLATATKVAETLAPATVSSLARSETWSVAYSPTATTINEVFSTTAVMPRTFSATLTNVTQVNGGFGGIYTDTIRYTQSIILPAATTTAGAGDVYFPYTASDVVLGAPGPGQIGLTAPPTGNATYVATVEEVAGVRTLKIEWVVTNVPQPATTVGPFSVTIPSFVDTAAPQTYVDSTGVTRNWYQPFSRSATNNFSIERAINQQGSVSVSNMHASSTFSDPLTTSITHRLRGTFATAGGSTVDETAKFFDKTLAGQEANGKHAIVNGSADLDEIDSTRRTIEYVLRGIENKDDRQLDNFFITDEGWDTSLVEFRGIKVGQFRSSTAAPPAALGTTQRIELWYKVDGDANWRRYGTGLLTADFNDEITAAQLIADYKLRVSATMPGTETITGVQIRFASSAGVYNIPRQMRVFTPTTGPNAGKAQWPVIRFAGALQDDGGEIPKPLHLDPIVNTVKMSYTPQGTTIEQSMTSSATVRYRNDEIVNVSDGKQLRVWRNGHWEAVSATSQISFGEILMYSVTLENDSMTRSINNPAVIDTLDPRTKLLDPAHPAWLTMDRPRAELTVAKTGALSPTGQWITEPTRLDYDNPAHAAQINALLRFDTIGRAPGGNPNFPDPVLGRPAPADRPERGFQYSIPAGPYPVLRTVSVDKYSVGSGGATLPTSQPTDTTRMEWWFTGSLGVADWELDPPAPLEPYKKNANGAITVSYLVTLIDPETPEWPPGIPKPDLDNPLVPLYIQNDFWARENLHPGGNETEWDGEPGGANVTVARPRLVAGVTKTGSAATRNVGQTIDYTITLRNNSNVALGNHVDQMILDPKIVDLLPVGFDFVSLESYRFKEDATASNSAAELRPTNTVTITNFTQASTAAGSTDVHKGVTFGFPAGTTLWPNQSIVLVVRVLVEGTGIDFGTATSKANNWNNVAAYLGKRNGNDIKYSNIMPTIPANGYPSTHANATASTNPGGPTLTKYLTDNGMGAAQATVHQRVDVTLNNPVVRPEIAVAVVTGTGTTGNTFSTKSMVSDATKPTIMVDLFNRDASDASGSRIADSAVQVLIPNDLAFRFGPGDVDAGGNLTTAGIAKITQSVVLGDVSRATVNIVSGKIEAIGSDPVASKRLTLMLGEETHIGYAAGVRLRIPADVEPDARPNMFETNIVGSGTLAPNNYGNNRSYDVRGALLPNLSQARPYFYIANTTTQRFDDSTDWGVGTVRDGVQATTTMIFRRALPVPYVRTLLTANTTGIAAPSAVNLTLSNGSEFLANVTARNYGDEVIYDGKLHTLLPRGAFYIETNNLLSSVGAGSQLGAGGFAPTLSWVGGQQLLTWDIVQLSSGMVTGNSQAVNATAAQNAEIRITVKLGTGVAYGTNNQVTSFLATKDVVKDAGVPRFENGFMVYNYFYREAMSTTQAGGAMRDRNATIIGYTTASEWPAGFSNNVSGTTPNTQQLVTTNEYDPLFAAVAHYDLNGDGNAYYTDYRKVGETFTPFSNNNAISDRAVRHAVQLNIDTMFDAQIMKSVRAWDYDANDWGPSQHGSTAAEATRAGKVEYTVTLTNNTIFDFEKISVVDLFPHVGDVTIVGGTPRGSTFSVTGGSQLNLAVFHRAAGGGAVPVPVAPTNYAAGLTVGSPPVLDSWNTVAGTGIFNMSATAPTAKSTGLKLDFVESVKVRAGESLIITFELEVAGDAPLTTAFDRFSATNSAAMRFDFMNATNGAFVGTFTGDQLATFTPSVVAVERDTGIGDFVWRDTNKNGIQDAGEEGINGLVIGLWKLKAGGNPAVKADYTRIAQTTTGNYIGSGGVADPARPGWYYFDSIADGTYRIEFSLPANGSPEAQGYSSYAFTLFKAGVDQTKNSKAITTAGDWLGFSEAVVVDGDTPLTAIHLNIDAGLTCEGAMLGDMVWYDANENGLMDGGEAGIGGVTVELYRVVSGAPEATPWQTRVTHTNAGGGDTTATGYYDFDQIPVGTYAIRFVLPGAGFAGENGWRFSPVTASGSTAGVGGWTSQFTVTGPANNQLTWDAGLAYNNITIGNTVWLDVNGNGLKDVGEDGIAGVTVKLFTNSVATPGVFDVEVASTTTNATGNYTFTKLAPGSYVVQVTLPTTELVAGYTNKWSPKTAGGSAINVATGRTDVIVATGSNTSYLTANAGVALDGALSIGDFVWQDTNGNGTQDAGEPGIAGVTVKLYKVVAGIDVLEDTTTTNASGNYLFEGLEPGSYRVEVVMPTTRLVPGYLQEFTTKGGTTLNTSTGSAINPSTGKTDIIVIDGAGGRTSYLFADAGIKINPNISIGDRVWLDRNGNGIQDAVDEPGIENVVVRLYRVVGGVAEATALATTTTNASGNYLFSNLHPGEYQVEVVMPTNTLVAGYTQRFTTKGGTTANSSTGSAVNVATGRTDTINATGLDGTTDRFSYLYADAGIAIDPNISIGDLVWLDTNGNGTKDATESGIENVVVRLYRVVGGVAEATALAATTTNASGNYLFSGLHPGDYQVEVVMPSTRLVPGYLQEFTTKGGTTANGSTGSAVNVATGRTDTINATGLDGAADRFTYLFADAGIKIIPNISIGDTVWLDRDGNGIQGSTESGIQNVVVRLYRVVGGVAEATALATTLTNAAGNYLFADLHPGDYQVEVVMPGNTLVPGYLQRFTTQGGTTLDSNTGSTVDATTGRTGVINATGLNGAADRFTYLFADAGIAIDPNISIGDFVWLDFDGDGLANDMIDDGAGGEKLWGIEGVLVKLYKYDDNADEFVYLDETTTDADGYYLFEELHPGDYRIQVIMPDYTLVPGYTQRFTTKGLSKANTSLESAVDLDGWTDTIEATGLDGLADRFAYKFNHAGIAVDGAIEIGDMVWLDRDGNGLKDDFITVDGVEKLEGVPNVRVELYVPAPIQGAMAFGFAPFGSGEQLLDTTLTDEDGHYDFVGLIPGEYKVRVIMPEYRLVDGYDQRFTEKNVSSANDNLFSAVDADGWTDWFTVTGLEEGTDIDRFNYRFSDAGIALDAALSIGDTVWLDRNANGIQDDRVNGKLEGIADVTVELFEGNFTTPIATTTTDVDGKYLFSSLEPGTYRVKVTMPDRTLVEGHTQAFFVPKNNTTENGSTGSAVDADGWTDDIVITGANERLEYLYADAGISLTEIPVVVDPPKKDPPKTTPKAGDDTQGMLLGMTALTLMAATIAGAGVLRRRKEQDMHA